MAEKRKAASELEPTVPKKKKRPTKEKVPDPEPLITGVEKRSQYNAAGYGAEEYHEAVNDAFMVSNQNIKESKPAITPANSKKRAARTKSARKKDTKSRNHRNSEEIEFVIHTRDNNLPNAFGTHSTAAGKLPYSQVAELYNAKFDKKVGAAALEKRYRLSIDAYCKDNPTYPRNIVYVQKLKPEQKAPRTMNKEESTSNIPRNNIEWDHQPEEQHVHPVKNENSNDERPKTNTKHILWRDGYGTCNPPHFVKEVTDSQNYFNLARPIRDQEHPLWLIVTVENSRGHPCGSIDVPTGDILRTSTYFADLLKEVLSVDCALENVGKKTLERYIDCISPMLRESLPEYDFTLARLRQSDGNIQRIPIVSQIDWNFAQSIDLYVLAAQLQDDHVRNLVLNHWRHMCRQDGEKGLDRRDLNRFFHGTEPDDPGRKFWVEVLLHQGLAEDIVANIEHEWHSTLIMLLKQKLGSMLQPSPWETDDTTFFREYHHHHESNKARLEHISNNIEANTPEYHAIATRILRAALRDTPHQLQSFIAKENMRTRHLGDTEGVKELAAEFERQHSMLKALCQEPIMDVAQKFVESDTEDELRKIRYKVAGLGDDDDEMSDPDSDEDY